MSAQNARERVLKYLYGGMTPAEAEAFAKDLAEDRELARLLAEEERFQQRFPAGVGAEVPEELLTESRTLLRTALRREARRPGSLWERLAGFCREIVPNMARVGAAAALLLGGVLLGRAVLGTGPLAGEMEIVDLRVREFHPESGRVKLVLSALSTVEIEGQLGDQAVLAVLAGALQGDTEAEARLAAVGLLGYQATATDVRQALIHALLHDENPGVRVAAVETLKALAGEEQVRQTLCQILLHDENPGVRVAAVEALARYRDPVTRQVMERKERVDDNEYIRAVARRALEEWQTASEAQEL